MSAPFDVIIPRNLPTWQELNRRVHLMSVNRYFTANSVRFLLHSSLPSNPVPGALYWFDANVVSPGSQAGLWFRETAAWSRINVTTVPDP